MEHTIYVIFNPTADHGKALKHVSQIEASLDRHNIVYKLELTRSSGHAIKLAREAARQSVENYRAGRAGLKAVVAAGGDGTVNEVINGLMEANADLNMSGPQVEFPALGVIPVGRGNDFAYGAGVVHDLEKACRLLKGEKRYDMDVGVVRGGLFPQGRYFGNGIGIGFDTLVGLEAAKVAWIPGSLGYVYGALKTLMVYPQSPIVRLFYDGGASGTQRVEVHSQQISIMNGRRMGGAFFMAPGGINFDKMLDLCMTRGELRRGQLLSALGQYTRGTQAGNPHVLTDRAKTFEIESDKGGLVCHADGETVCTDGKKLQVECIPHALQMLGEAREG
ncbi:MAG: diacylglycerol kinase family protein [Spirochaetia bacterium]|nr:diacylglycerol kinase family protein [Spirochaetia bacterium]